ncbi:NAD(P)/FAD-dependent oxidoreductase [Alkalimarinus alittae]|uniref:NAD(P)-binding protein n=1 Tax=Alkalimarinus alittae TaxID=2961619 RepID=A0ABY6N444_9ALTE|nr:NAD(P)-binding protein [Alkalimarinus alittae]UZE96805.1 NAD(P)-binding protein [Alkalimarinus alittae]
MNKTLRGVAIIGAGTAGALAANQLSAAGLDCCIVEKSRGLGGRCSRRRVLDYISVDIGAPHFSIPFDEHPILIANMNQWLRSGYLTEWLFTTGEFESQSLPVKKIELCGTPSMNAFHRHLAAGVDCLTQRHVHKLSRVNNYWQLLDQQGQLIVEAKAVIVTAPAEQTYNLVALHDLMSKGHQPGQHDLINNPVLSAAEASLPQYICAVTFDQPQTQLLDLYCGEHPVFSKAIRANSKFNHSNSMDHQTPEVWILHSTHSWAQQQQHKDAQSVAEDMARLFCQHFNTSQAKVITSHYWRLANHDHKAIKRSFEGHKPENQPFIWNNTLKLGCCADWLAGGGVAGALSSSQHLCNHITSQLTQEV